MKAKAQLRLAARQRRMDLEKSVPDFAVRIAAFAEDLPLVDEPIVAGYWPLRDEADPRAFMLALAERGAQLALPCISGRGELVFRSWRSGDPLVANRVGIAEPEISQPEVHPDVLLVPLLAFDSSGHRLGYGGGYYDRALQQRSVLAAGIAYAGQEVQTLPSEGHDRPLDIVVTELGVRRFGSA